METFNLIIKLVGILVIFYIGMNRLLYYLDGDHKTRNRNKRNEWGTPKNIMNNPDRINQVILITLIGLLSLLITLPYILN